MIDYTPYLNRPIVAGVPVEVYRNLNRGPGVWYSVRQQGRIIGHCRGITLVGCTMVVQPAGRARVLATGRKNVHAYVRGLPADDDLEAETWYALRYDPRKYETFVNGYGNPCREAPVVVLGSHGAHYAHMYWQGSGTRAENMM